MKFGFVSLLLSYSRLVIFAAVLLLGIQVPSFVLQYQQRVDAHFREVSQNIAGFQRTADALFEGDLQRLVAYYAGSRDAVFERDADSVQQIVNRYQRLSAEQAAMQQTLPRVALHIAVSADAEMFDETLSQYNYTVPLNLLSVEWGLALAVILTLALDGALFGCGKCVKYLARRRRVHQQTQGHV